MVLDEEGRILRWNEEVERLLGESAPLQGRKLIDYLSGGDALTLAGWLADLREHGGRSLTPQPLTLRNLGGDARRVALTSPAMAAKDAFCVVVQPLPTPSCPLLAALEHQPAPAVVLRLPILRRHRERMSASPILTAWRAPCPGSTPLSRRVFCTRCRPPPPRAALASGGS